LVTPEEGLPVELNIDLNKLQEPYGLKRKQVEDIIADLRALGFLVDEESELNSAQRHCDANRGVLGERTVRPRKYENDAVKMRAYRQRKRQLGILLLIENPPVGSLPWQVQYAEYCRLLRGEKPSVCSPKVRKAVRQRAGLGPQDG
jgi:hypothetical protein